MRHPANHPWPIQSCLSFGSFLSTGRKWIAHLIGHFLFDSVPAFEDYSKFRSRALILPPRVECPQFLDVSNNPDCQEAAAAFLRAKARKCHVKSRLHVYLSVVSALLEGFDCPAMDTTAFGHCCCWKWLDEVMIARIGFCAVALNGLIL